MMTHNTPDQIINKILDVTTPICNSIQNIEGIVGDMNISDKSYHISSKCSPIKLLCCLSVINEATFPDNMFPFAKGDNIQIIGQIKFNKQDNVIYIDVTNHMTYDETMQNMLKKYRNVEKILLTQKIQTRIQMIKSLTIPDKLSNISFIIVANDNLYAETIKKLDNVYGNINIYRTSCCDIADILAKIISSNQHLIHIIGIELSIKQIVELSSSKLITQLLQNKHIYTITTFICTGQYVIPLATRISSVNTQNIDEGIQIITRQQQINITQYDKLFDVSKIKLMTCIKKLEYRLEKYNSVMNRQLKRNNDNPEQKIITIKKLMIKHLDNKILELEKKEALVMKKLLSDIRTIKAIESAVEVERVVDPTGQYKLLANKKKNDLFIDNI